ncbi:hypothetical protein GCM10009747_29290 [Agromyces humatus]|uniref:Uncharacterized protein n=1 Tax=Agromyces humatus TaxID=279573 RepID=A0ABP4X0X3_9MICO
MLLREYLYVDTDKVRGLAGQLYDGVPERATNVAARQKSLGFDARVIKGDIGKSDQDSIERSLADSVFKDLEADLEALGLLTDVSELLAQLDQWDDIDTIARPGRIIRLSAPATLFHPSQMSEAMVGMATAAMGLGSIGIADSESEPPRPVPPSAKSTAQKKAERDARDAGKSERRYPEDELPTVEVIPLMGIPRGTLAGMIQVVRGVFGEGVHLHGRPAGPEGPVVSARLESGRRFLDSSPEVLLSRYGLGEQEWTVVGVVGQLGSRVLPGQVDDVTNSDGSVNRAKLVDVVGTFLGSAAGLVDLPQAPGFSIVPLAVYRLIGEPLAPIEG